MGKQLDATVDMLKEIREEGSKNPYVAGNQVTTNNLLASIAISMAIIADEAVRSNDLIIKMGEEK